MHRRVAALAVLALAVALAALALPATGAAAPPPADQYIVVLKDSADSKRVASQHRRRHGARVKHVYSHALKGYAARISGRELGAVRSDPRVRYVEKDGEARASTTQTNATWGLDRVDARSGLDGTYTYDHTGTGVKAYIIDTGILTTHSDFGGRAVHGRDTVDGDDDASDCDGHGTHVAGTVGGTAYGVAKAATLVAVRVLDCSGSGTWSGVIAGMDWVTGDHAAGTPAVANLSLGGGASTSVDDATQRMIDDGIATAIAAGNGNMGGKEQDACGYSPARVPDAMTIGATTSTDSKTSWSNYGSCVDFFAPGASITSAWHTSDTATNTISGTSMAAPHVAGAAALYLQGNGTATALQVRDALYAATTKGIVTNSKTANNHLLYTLFGSSTTTDTVAPAAPTGLTAAPGDTTVTLSWNANTEIDLKEYGVYRDGVRVGTVIPSASPSFEDRGLTNGTSYAYTVTAVDTSSNESAHSAEATATPTAGTSAVEPATITLSATGSKVKGVKQAELSWSGTTATDVDIYRDGTKVKTTANDGTDTDVIGKGGGTHVYKVCETGTSTCSNESTVVF